jgi:predicted RNA-binding Zn ribbon-like protein
VRISSPNEQGELDAAAPQPGGRQPAPHRLATVQAFINTHYDLSTHHGGELFVSPEALRDWLAVRDLLGAQERLTHHDLQRAVAVREGLRALAFANNHQPMDTRAIDNMRRACEDAVTQIRIDPAGPHFLPPADTSMDGAIGVLQAITASAMIDGNWQHLKACLGRDCGWAFYDRSRNQSARWCAISVCGQREKARAYYRRKITQRG